MPIIRETRHLGWSCEQMFDLVADVGSYPQFLPWVMATRIRQNSDEVMLADMVVGFGALRETFSSRVNKHRPERISVEYLDGPLKKLENLWVFKPAEASGCEISFLVEFSFRNAIFEAMAGQYLDRAFRKMVAAFEARAEALYGKA